jgi:hypothetical protein
MRTDRGGAPGAAHPPTAPIKRAAAIPFPDTHSLADVIERLITDFEPHLPLPVISAVVQRCRADLDIITAPALPELLERLARQRLHDLATARSTATETGEEDTPPANDKR